ncbi:MAG TPA: hypothetical protein VGF13_23580 [Verrucomicrobiae bacterium]|jgi:hypothetical protein
MSTVAEIKRAIEQLPSKDFLSLTEWLERRRAELEAEEDRQDLEAARRSLAEPGENIPLEKIAKELGL